MDTRTVEAGYAGQSLAESIDDYRLSLHASGKSKSTQAVYTLALTYFDRFLEAQGMPRHLSGIRREHVEAWLGAVRDQGRAPATVSVYYRSLQPFWRWCVDEGFIRDSPMAHMRPPTVPEQPVPVLTLDEIRATRGRWIVVGAVLLVVTVAACSGTPATPTVEPSAAYKLARVNAYDEDRPDLRTDAADAERQFQGVLDCVRRAYPDETEEQAADKLYASWSESAKRETLLEWAVILCPPS